MGSWAGISWRSVWATCLATTVRAALSTFTTWDQCCQLLLDAFSLDLSWMPFAQVRLHSYQPAGWDTCSIAATLAEASKGFPRCAALRTFLPQIIGASRLAVQQFALESPGKRFKLQQFLYANVVKIIFPDNVEVALCRRSRRFSDPGLTPGSLDIYRALLNALPKAIAQQALRAALNGWCTSFRMNEAVKYPALCGCNHQRDELDHYLCCPVIWSIAAATDSLVYPASKLHACALFESSLCTIIRIAVITNAYHFVKNSRATDILGLINSQNREGICQVWCDAVFQSYLNARERPDIHGRIFHLSRPVPHV